MTRPIYALQTVRWALGELDAGREAAEVAGEIGCHVWTIRRWRRERKLDARHSLQAIDRFLRRAA